VGQVFGIGLIEYEIYKKAHGKVGEPDMASMMANLAIQRFTAVDLLGHEVFKMPTVRVREMLLIEEVKGIGRIISQEREMKRLENQ